MPSAVGGSGPTDEETASSLSSLLALSDDGTGGHGAQQPHHHHHAGGAGAQAGGADQQDPGSKVKLTCSVALLNISMRPDAENIFLEQVRRPAEGESRLRGGGEGSRAE